ncbi:hypothetical protein NKJ06_30565 [Mesorhizobium sp. M0293]
MWCHSHGRHQRGPAVVPGLLRRRVRNSTPARLSEHEHGTPRHDRRCRAGGAGRRRSTLRADGRDASGALARLAAGHESDPAEQQDLVQDIHLQVWRSLKSFDGRCLLRT